jgi:hypothetical protein
MQVDRASTSVNVTASANLLSESRSGANIARDFTRRGVAAGQLFVWFFCAQHSTCFFALVRDHDDLWEQQVIPCGQEELLL